jgi:hypothetical protein
VSARARAHVHEHSCQQRALACACRYLQPRYCCTRTTHARAALNPPGVSRLAAQDQQRARRQVQLDLLLRLLRLLLLLLLLLLLPRVAGCLRGRAVLRLAAPQHHHAAAQQ